MNPREPDHLFLRALFDEAVSDVDPDPALNRIQTRTKVAPMASKNPWLYGVIGAVAATAATVTTVFVLSNNNDPVADGPVASNSSSPTPTTPTDEPSESSGSPSPVAAAVPVYYVAATPTGTRLFREFHRVTVSNTEKLTAGLTEAVSGTPLDADYRTDWPAGTSIGSTSIDGVGADGIITIDVTSPSSASLHDRPSGLAEVDAQMAIEQLIYTAQAAAQARAAVQFRLDGGPTDTLLGVPVSEPLAEGDPMKVQGTVWITSPQNGDTVAGTFTVAGRGAFFEANVSWQLLQNSEVVDSGFAMAKQCCTLSPYSFKITAEPGDYVLRVFDADMSGGEGNGEAEDTKQITVE